MQKTALFDKHVTLGAKMCPFAGFEMPVQYSGAIEEHFAVRERVGMFDVSHMGQFIVEGPQATEFLQRTTTNDVAALEVGKAQYSCIPNEKGGIVDDLILYKMDKNKYLLVVNASNIAKDWAHFSQHNSFGAQMTDISHETSLIAVQGPMAQRSLQKLTSVDLSKIPYYHFAVDQVAGVKQVLISNTGYTGSGGFELYLKSEDSLKIWDGLSEAGKEFGLIPCGLAARDTLRLEKGFCLYGHDIDDSTSPLEAGLGWITKFNKEFIAKDLLWKQKLEGISRKLIGFEMKERAIPRESYSILNSSGEGIGKVSSGTMSPTKKLGIGMAYLPSPYFKPKTEIFIQIRNKRIPAEVVKFPFV